MCVAKWRLSTRESWKGSREQGEATYDDLDKNASEIGRLFHLRKFQQLNFVGDPRFFGNNNNLHGIRASMVAIEANWLHIVTEREKAGSEIKQEQLLECVYYLLMGSE